MKNGIISNTEADIIEVKIMVVKKAIWNISTLVGGYGLKTNFTSKINVPEINEMLAKIARLGKGINMKPNNININDRKKVFGKTLVGILSSVFAFLNLFFLVTDIAVPNVITAAIKYIIAVLISISLVSIIIDLKKFKGRE